MMKSKGVYHWTEQYYSELDDMERKESELRLSIVNRTQNKRRASSCHCASDFKGYNQASQNKNKNIASKEMDYGSVFKLLNTNIYIPFFSGSQTTNEKGNKDLGIKSKTTISAMHIPNKAINRDTNSIQLKKYGSNNSQKQKLTNQNSQVVKEKETSHIDERRKNHFLRRHSNRDRDVQLNTHQRRGQTLSSKTSKRGMKDNIEEIQKEVTESEDIEAIYRVLPMSNNHLRQAKTEVEVVTGDFFDENYLECGAKICTPKPDLMLEKYELSKSSCKSTNSICVESCEQPLTSYYCFPFHKPIAQPKDEYGETSASSTQFSPWNDISMSTTPTPCSWHIDEELWSMEEIPTNGNKKKMPNGLLEDLDHEYKTTQDDHCKDSFRIRHEDRVDMIENELNKTKCTLIETYELLSKK